MTLDDGPKIVLPDGFQDKSGIYMPSSFDIAPNVAVPPELLPRPDLLVVGRAGAPSFYDQIFAYATQEELGLETTSADDIVAITREIGFWPSMRFLSRLQRDLWNVRTDQEGQVALLKQWFEGSRFEDRAVAWLGQEEQRVLFSEQQIFALQRLVLLNARDGDVDEPHSPEEFVLLLMALVAAPGTLLTTEDDLRNEGPSAISDERWMRLFVGHGGFIGRGSLRNELGRAFRLYLEIASSETAKDHHDYCPVEEWLNGEYGLSFEELQAFALALHTGSKMLDENELPTLIDASYFATTLLADKAQQGLDVLSEPREWYSERFANSQTDSRRAAFEITPFLQQPALRQPDGKVMPFAPRAIEAWISATGNYYRLFDIARAKGSSARKRFTRFNGVLVENYVTETATRAYPPRPTHKTIWLPGTVLCEQTYTGRGGERRTPDVAIDQTPDLLLIEVTSSRLTERSVVDADPDAVQKDIEKVLVDKIEQLGSAIADIRDGVATLPGIEMATIERIWPLIVSSEGVFQTPTLWAYIEEAVTSSLEQPKVQPLTLLDLEDVEELFGLVASGYSILDVLRAKTTDAWRERELAVWLGATRPEAAATSPIARENLDKAFDSAVETLFTEEAIEEHRSRLAGS